MEGLNLVMLLGNVGKDPELRHGKDDRAYLRFSLATNDSYVDKAGERHERTDWHAVVVFGKRAEALARILKKGSPVGVLGRTQTREYTDAEGTRRWTTEIIPRQVYLLGSKPKGEPEPPPAEPPEAPADVADDDEIPF